MFLLKLVEEEFQNIEISDDVIYNGGLLFSIMTP